MPEKIITRTPPKLLVPIYLDLEGNITGTTYAIDILDICKDNIIYIVDAVKALESGM